ncbi:MAG TPA: transcription repressor NadR [Lachnospiraceae bacterium]|jgi:uncharacterized protein|nr:transcription repressor NadR [Lachnospiraceae bacterium]
MEIAMNGQERRKGIIHTLTTTGQPISGTKLAEEFGVSRQVIVQDIALLRSEKHNIISTTQGYLISGADNGRVRRRIAVKHSRQEIAKELNIIVDFGGKVLDVIVEHPVYGEISATLIISNRKDVKEFVHKIEHQKGIPLLAIADGVHTHTVEADSAEILDEIEEELQREGFGSR